MGSIDLDRVDKGILYLLQRDARRITTQEMGDAVGVSASTVRNRIERLEEAGVLRGYYPDVDYEKAGLQLHVQFVCSAPNPDRERLARAACEVEGVVAVREVLNGEDDVQVEAVGTDTDDVARIGDGLGELGLEVKTAKILKSEYRQPFDHFGDEVAEDEAAKRER